MHHDSAAAIARIFIHPRKILVFARSGGMGADGMMLAPGRHAVHPSTLSGGSHLMKKLALNVDTLKVQPFPYPPRPVSGARWWRTADGRTVAA
jgi:hypothetical protein